MVCSVCAVHCIHVCLPFWHLSAIITTSHYHVQYQGYNTNDRPCITSISRPMRRTNARFRYACECLAHDEARRSTNVFAMVGICKVQFACQCSRAVGCKHAFPRACPD
ncbi:hypothetical protein PLICRDRAFT_353079 [Plicaturopsis crispa FD-325 SS-3]|uniref:SWIM-type domain-containing protein n=1 Tax=Plicaturopsis crispa FD-325 SS-3 TaxID=944288 RepID=A0A0C9T8L5_PLICR|nr:hypothetical protein PLICRDRAFT_353079 [Plicaturopsis crispa FD-325 SS-3]